MADDVIKRAQRRSGEELFDSITAELVVTASYPPGLWSYFARDKYPFLSRDIWDLISTLFWDATDGSADDTGCSPIAEINWKPIRIAAAMIIKAASEKRRFVSVSRFVPGEHYHVKIYPDSEKFDTLKLAKEYIASRGYICDGLVETVLPLVWR